VTESPKGSRPSAGEPDAPGALELESLEAELGHRFRDRGLLETSLRHSSYAHEQARETQAPAATGESNERLEFLGDAVIGMVVAHLLYAAHPGWPEGDLTRALHQLVDRRGLARLARQLGLGAHLQLGRTELRSGGRAKDSILADAMEAVVGAMFLDGGLEPVEAFARRVFDAALAVDAPRVEADPKTRLQEWAMASFGVFPSYRLLHDSEVEGDDSRFRVEVRIDETPCASGSARSKRQAEMQAARAAYERRDELAAALRRAEP
jgi:ribonuclease III